MVVSYPRVGGVMVAALVLGTSGAIRGGSSPLPRTMFGFYKEPNAWFYKNMGFGENSFN